MMTNGNLQCKIVIPVLRCLETTTIGGVNKQGIFLSNNIGIAAGMSRLMH